MDNELNLFGSNIIGGSNAPHVTPGFTPQPISALSVMTVSDTPDASIRAMTDDEFVDLIGSSLDPTAMNKDFIIGELRWRFSLYRKADRVVDHDGSGQDVKFDEFLKN
jgi:hypothetical protein